GVVTERLQVRRELDLRPLEERLPLGGRGALMRERRPEARDFLLSGEQPIARHRQVAAAAAEAQPDRERSAGETEDHVCDDHGPTNVRDRVGRNGGGTPPPSAQGVVPGGSWAARSAASV